LVIEPLQPIWAPELVVPVNVVLVPPLRHLNNIIIGPATTSSYPVRYFPL
jgi:hypothetical protein